MSDEEDDWICGESYDHDIETTYEGDDGWQGVCRCCGAEFWEDPPAPSSPVNDEAPPV